MIHLANFSIRRPKIALAVWLALAGVLVAIGLGISDRLSPTMTLVPGSEASRAQDLAESEFGPSVLVPILLEGPKAQLDRQGPPLVRKLASRSDTRVLSAWDGGDAAAQLRPSANQAMLVASVARSEDFMLEKGQGQIDRTVANSISAPVRPHITGTPTLDRAIKDESLDSTKRGLVIAIPLLFVALLLILRAPLAAAATTAFGAVTAFAGLGVMSLVAKVFEADGIAVALGALMGLALGAGLSLVILSRFHAEEAKLTGAPQEATLAASNAVATTGRAVLIGGTGLIIALVVATIVGPTQNLNSVGVGSVVCGLLGIGAAVVVMPALLSLMGSRLFAGSFGAPRFVTAPWKRLVGAGGFVVRRAVFVGFAATLLLGAFAIPVLDMKTGPPAASVLPEDSVARQDFEAVQRAMGPGWPTPFNIIVASDKRPVTERRLLRQLERFQLQIARDDRVASVTGPGVFRARTAALGTLEGQLNKSKKLLKGGKKDLAKLEGGLGQAGSGAAQLQGGLSEAADGATQLAGGGSTAQEGAGKLRAGLGQARSGSAQISTGLDTALEGANALKAGSGEALAGAQKLSGGLGQAEAPVTQGLPVVQDLAKSIADSSAAVKGASTDTKALSGQLNSALAALDGMTTGKDDPGYQKAVSALQQAQGTAGRVDSTLGGASTKLSGSAGVSSAFATQVGELSKGLGQLHAGSTELTGGIARLRGGNTALAEGLGKLSGGGKELTGGLGQLQTGAGQLESGLGLLTAGADELGGGLSSGVPKVGQLASGLGQMKSGVAKFSGDLPSPKDLERLGEDAPGLFDSGYFVLAAIEGAQPSDRNQATFAVNLDRGGTAGQILVVPKRAANSKQTQELGEDLVAMSARFAARSDTEAAVGGPAGELADFQSDIGADVWPVILAVTVAVALFLMVALRSVALALVTVAFNLLVTAATFGIVTLLTRGDDPVLGGPGYIDSLQVIETFAAAFGIALIFEVLLLYRTRELFVRTGDPHESLVTGLRDTAAAATGAAAVMVAAVIPFVASGLYNIRLTIALAIALALDALIVRPVLLPAAVSVLGRRGWWPTKPRDQIPPPPPDEAPTAPSGRWRRRAKTQVQS